MDAAELLFLSDCNLAEFCREQGRWLPPYDVSENPHALFVAAGTRFPAGPSNCVFPLEHSPDVAMLLDEAQSYFSRLGRGFSIYAPAHHSPELARACEERNWPRLADAPGMGLTDHVDPPEIPAGVELRTVRSESEANDFIDVSAESYESIGLPNTVTRKLLSKWARWNRPYIHAEVAYENDRAVAAAMLLFSHGIAGVYWVGTLSSARGRGHATRLMRSVSLRAFERGARGVVLQATQFGEPIYRKLGYREITRYRWYLVNEAD
jgi:ribosomal protein S18 acetylase RimI-like enzyme